MSSAIERRRAAKAARRKMVVAMKRKLASGGAGLPLAQRARLLARRPLHSCLSQDGLFERGNGVVLLARRRAEGDLVIASFLLDTFCLGVKDVVFRDIEPSALEAYIEAAEEVAPLLPVDLAYARKLLRQAAAYARSLGFAPHRDYSAAASLFGDVSADDCPAQFCFGREGKALYMPGPSETLTQFDRRIEQLRAQVGNDGYDVVIPQEVVDAALAVNASGEREADPPLAASGTNE